MTWDVTCARWAEMIRRVTPKEPEVLRLPDPVPQVPVRPS